MLNGCFLTYQLLNKHLFPSFLFLNRFCFLEQFMVKLTRMSRVPRYLQFPLYTQPPFTISVFVIISELALTHHYHPGL